jgi:hypothetical protein
MLDLNPLLFIHQEAQLVDRLRLLFYFSDHFSGASCNISNASPF